MMNFDFHNPTHIVFGHDRLDELDGLVPKDARLLILYGGGSVKRFGTLDKVIRALEGRDLFEFGGVEPNPRFSTLIKAVAAVKENNIDFLLAVGGGSVMDGTKFVALAAAYEGAPEDILYRRVKAGEYGNVLPIGNVVTLPATGSEMNSGGVITHGKGKYVVGSPLVFPRFSILDPALTYTLPPAQVANGVIDTFVHVCEQYLTYPVDARLQDRMAEAILRTMVEIGRKTMDDPADYDLRANLMWSATMALNGLLRCGVPQDWSTHMIGHELTALFGIDHARTLAVILPVMLETRKEQKREKLLQYASRVWDIDEGDEESRINEAIKKTRDFFESLDVKTRLGEYGVKRAELTDVIAGLKDKKMTKLSERGDLGPDQVLAILNAAY